MRKLIEITVFASVGLLWVFAMLSIPMIPDPCCVCHERTRTRTVVEWAFTKTPSLHWECAGQYNSAIHNPNGGVK